MCFRPFRCDSGAPVVRPSLLAVAVVLLVSSLAASSAWAIAYTPVNPAVPPEKSTNEILSHIYGGTFVPVGLDYTNGVITATRIADNAAALGRPTQPLRLYDDRGGDASLLSGPESQVTDQLWTADEVVAIAQARYAVYTQRFGYFDGTDGGSYIPVFDVTGEGFNVSGSGSIGDLSGHTFRWARAGGFFTFTSQNTDNPDDIDHMVTYRIDFGSTNLGSVTTYLLFWEDKAPNDNPPPDYDYNDLVVEIRVAVIPEPATGFGAAAMIGLLATRRRRS